MQRFPKNSSLLEQLDASFNRPFPQEFTCPKHYWSVTQTVQLISIPIPRKNICQAFLLRGGPFYPKNYIYTQQFNLSFTKKNNLWIPNWSTMNHKGVQPFQPQPLQNHHLIHLFLGGESSPQKKVEIYPLVNVYSLLLKMANKKPWFTYQRWWFSMVFCMQEARPQPKTTIPLKLGKSHGSKIGIPLEFHWNSIEKTFFVCLPEAIYILNPYW